MGLKRTLIDVTPLRSSPQFRRLWLGQSLSGFGGQMTLVAVMFQVWQMTESPTWTGAVGLAQAVPLVALGLFAGSLVDQVDHRKFYLLTISGQAVCSLLLALQGFLGHVPAAGVLGLVALQSCFGAGSGPASRTFIPHLLPKHQLAAGLALRRIAFQGAMLLGPALSGLIVLTEPRLRSSSAAASAVRAVAVELGGRPGQRLCTKLRLHGRRTALLGQLIALPIPARAPRVPGIDEFAGCSRGTGSRPSRTSSSWSGPRSCATWWPGC